MTGSMPSQTSPRPVFQRFWWAAALASILVALAAATLLALKNLPGFQLPGCGPGSGCDQISASPWGKVLGWPVSYLGFAYFLAATVGWGLSQRGVRLGPAVITTLAGAVSLTYVIVALSVGPLCAYCVAANGANLAFVALVWLVFVCQRGPAAGGSWAMPVGLGAFLLATGATVVVDDLAAKSALSRASEERATQVAKVLEKAARDAQAARPAGPAPAPNAPNLPVAPSAPPSSQQGFTGRWRQGPAEAPVRVVMFMGYQCPDCKLLEVEARELLKTEPRLSLSVKHFPMSTDCNPRIGRNMHPNGCWAARAAEAAGIIEGETGFWRMHDWLLGRGGAFTDGELNLGLAQLGFDRARFLQVMQTPEALARVQADIAEGWDLGLFFTPMIFVNGVELKGWQAPRALTKTVQEVLAANPPALSAAADRPPGAIEKHIADWRDQPLRAINLDSVRPAGLGPPDAPVRIVVWGDLQEPGTGEADSYLRELLKRRADIRYEFRHYPVNRSCNPSAPRDLFPQGCLAARAAEAAGLLGGADGYWRMQEWLVNNRQGLSEQTLRSGISAAGLEADRLLATMSGADVSARIAADGRDAAGLGLQSIPAIFVNGRLVPRWKIAGGGPVVLERIADRAR